MKQHMIITSLTLMVFLIGPPLLTAETCSKGNCTDGKGTLLYADGGSYEGEFKEGKFDGYGKRVYEDGKIYEGEFKAGKYEGKGTLILANGTKYVCEFKNGKREGRGVVINRNGGGYTGTWKDGTYDGHGELRLSNGERYVGDFKNGNREGQGVYTFPNGAEYRGSGRITSSMGRDHRYLQMEAPTPVNSGRGSGMGMESCFMPAKSGMRENSETICLAVKENSSMPMELSIPVK